MRDRELSDTSRWVRQLPSSSMAWMRVVCDASLSSTHNCKLRAWMWRRLVAKVGPVLTSLSVAFAALARTASLGLPAATQVGGNIGQVLDDASCPLHGSTYLPVSRAVADAVPGTPFKSVTAKRANSSTWRCFVSRSLHSNAVISALLRRSSSSNAVVT